MSGESLGPARHGVFAHAHPQVNRGWNWQGVPERRKSGLFGGGFVPVGCDGTFAGGYVAVAVA